MAVFNEILVGRFNRYLQKLLQMKGAPPAPQLSSEIQPQLQLATGGPDDLFLQSWNKYAVIADIAAGGAGNNGSFRLRNPAGSNVIAIIEKIRPFGDQHEVQYGQGLSDLATSLATSRRALDGRIASQTGATLVASQGAPAGAGQIGTTIYRHESTGLDEIIATEEQSFALSPGDGIAVVHLTANTRLIVTCWWRERFLEESERS